MDRYFIKWAESWSVVHWKYSITMLDNRYAIKVKPSYKKAYIFDSSTLGKFHDTECEAVETLKTLADKFQKQGNYIEWESEAKKYNSKMNRVKQFKQSRRKQYIKIHNGLCGEAIIKQG